MKALLLGAVAALALGTAAYAADDFRNNQAFVTAEYGEFEFTIEVDELNSFNQFELDYDVFEMDHSDTLKSKIELGASYYTFGDTFVLGSEYTLYYTPSSATVFYGSVAGDYVASSTLAIEGDFFVTPEVGVQHQLNDTFAIFSEIDYTWNASDDWAQTGGEIEAGLKIKVADNIDFVPSIVHYYDTPNDNTQARFGIRMKF